MSAPRGAYASSAMAKYPFLSDPYNDSYVPTVADWRALNLTAQFNRGFNLGSKLTATDFTLALTSEGMTALVGTRPNRAGTRIGAGGAFLSVMRR